jgi:hypothetical protein
VREQGLQVIIGRISVSPQGRISWSTVNNKYEKEPAETVKFLVVLKDNESTETENEPAKNDE